MTSRQSGFTGGIKPTDIASVGSFQGLIIMPEKIDAVDGTGYYSEDASITYKELLSLGYEVSYLTVKKSGIHRNGAVPDEIVSFMIGIAGNLLATAMWEGAKALIRLKAKKRVNPKIKGKVFVESHSKKHNSWVEYDIEGSIEDAITMIDKIQELHSDESITREKEVK